MTTKSIPATRTKPGDFWHDERQRRSSWPIAMTAISDATNQPLESVRLFLDSRHGRHFADDVLNEMLRGHTIQQAIDAAVTRWMGWTIGRQTSKVWHPQGTAFT